MSKRAERGPLVLVVDDRPNMLSLLKKVLQPHALTHLAGSGTEAIGVLEREPVSVVLCDLRMPDMDGIAVLHACKRLRPHAEFILMTAYASVDTAVEALRLGAYDYLTKPFEPEAVRAVVLRALGRAAAADPARAEGEALGEEVLPGILARSRPMLEAANMIRKVAASDATALVLGETGTGKERVARAIHALSPRAPHRFVAVNCAAIPTELLESELFGHARGSFTGANRDRMGLFEEAHGGTLFLDEIGEMRPSLQAKLTRALEERAVRRLGESRERNVDARLIVATHRDLAAMVAAGTFREDLWYRLNVAPIVLPPLRDRLDDVELLAVHFLRETAHASSRQIVGFTAAAVDALRGYTWPGNVRQLRSVIERACIVASGERIDVGDLSPEVVGGGSGSVSGLASMSWQQAVDASREEIAPRYLEELLRKHGGNVAEAAAQAGIERESFYRLLRKYGLRADDYR